MNKGDMAVIGAVLFAIGTGLMVGLLAEALGTYGFSFAACFLGGLAGLLIYSGLWLGFGAHSAEKGSSDSTKS